MNIAGRHFRQPAALLIPVQLSVTFSYQGSGWNDSGGTLYSPEAIISAKIKAIPGVQITPQFVQDGDVTIKEEYDNNTGTICSCPGFLADDALNPIVDIGTDSDGNIMATTTDDAPHDHPGSVTANLLWVQYSGNFRDYLKVQIGNNPPQVVAEVTWSTLESATFQPDPRTTPLLHYPTIYVSDSVKTVPDMGKTAYGAAPVDSPIQPPRTPTVNSYIGDSTNSKPWYP